ncbi:ArsR/SmtB family transcription factor [Micromonospora musae]|uniref:ArsR/SmtB family transcription factor n=1 Tax=Micromonospora musae TaxID=1894970 RepID=UPI0033EEE6BD
MEGDELVRVLTALASPQRLRILAVLAEGRRYVTELARQVGLSRPLVHAHLSKLAAAGLVSSETELSDEGHAMRYVSVTPFSLRLTPQVIAAAVATLAAPDQATSKTDEENVR